MALNCPELDYKTATTLSDFFNGCFVFCFFFFFNSGPAVLRPLAPDPSVLDLFADVKITFDCFYGTPHPSSVQQRFQHTNVISSVQPSILSGGQQSGFQDQLP